MSTYKNLIGKEIKFLTTNPDNDAAEGQIWYNSTTGEFKNLTSSEAWSSGGSLVTARKYLAGAGTQAASLAFGGNVPPPGFSNATEEYNGTGWGVGGNLGTARRYLAGAGTQTAGLAFGGGTPGSPPPTRAETEEYNGSTWSEQNDLNTARVGLAGCGIQTAALAFAGHPGSGFTTATEKYDGTSWTNTGAMSTARRYLAGAGTQTAGLAFGGKTPPNSDATEEFDGSSWTTGGSLNDARGYLAGAGIQTSALAFGGYNNKADTEQYDGTSWSNKSDLGTARESLAGAGASAGASVAFGGNTTAVQSVTEEFTSTVNVITAAAFSSGGNLNTARWGLGGAGTKSAAIVFGGRNPPVAQDLALSEEYDGSSWSEGPDLNTATRVCGRGTGTQTAALKHGGHSGSPSTSNKTAEEWNGSSWTNGGASTNNHDGTMQIGTQTAAASCGSNPPTGAKTEEYNGTSFSTSNDMPYSGYYGSASGSQTAGVVFGGYPNQNNSAEYDGTNWTAGNALLQPTAAQGGNGGSGTQTLAIGAGGYTPGPVYLTAAFTYDGTNFATAPSMSTARQEVAAQGANDSFYVAGGITQSTGAQNLTEEFTPESSALNVKTITIS